MQIFDPDDESIGLYDNNKFFSPDMKITRLKQPYKLKRNERC